MTHHLTHDGRVAVAADTYWLPIDASTPRNVKVLAIARESSGCLSVAEIHTVETWYTHWHPLPRFRAAGGAGAVGAGGGGGGAATAGTSGAGGNGGEGYARVTTYF